MTKPSTHVDIDAMSDAERATFFKMVRKFATTHLTVYDDDGHVVFTDDIDPTAYQHGVTFTLRVGQTRTILAHIRIGQWEFYQSYVGRDEAGGDQRRFTVSLP